MGKVNTALQSRSGRSEPLQQHEQVRDYERQLGNLVRAYERAAATEPERRVLASFVESVLQFRVALRAEGPRDSHAGLRAAVEQIAVTSRELERRIAEREASLGLKQGGIIIPPHDQGAIRRLLAKTSPALPPRPILPPKSADPALPEAPQQAFALVSMVHHARVTPVREGDASLQTREVFRKAREAGYEVRHVAAPPGTVLADHSDRFVCFQIYRTTQGPHGAKTAPIGARMVIDKEGSGEVDIGNGRRSSSYLARRNVALAEALDREVKHSAIEIEESSDMIHARSSPALHRLLSERNDLIVRFAGRETIGPHSYSSFDLLRRNGSGERSVITRIRVPEFSENASAERDGMLLASVRAFDAGRPFGGFEIGGPKVDAAIPMHSATTPRTAALMARLEGTGLRFECCGNAAEGMTFRVMDVHPGEGEYAGKLVAVSRGTFAISSAQLADAGERDTAIFEGLQNILLRSDFERRRKALDSVASARIAADPILALLQASAELDRWDLRGGYERRYALTMIEQLTSGHAAGRPAKQELEEIASPLLHMLQRIARSEPGYLEGLSKQSPEHLRRFCLVLGERLLEERRAITPQTLIDRETKIVALCHTDRRFGIDAMTKLMERLDVPKEKFSEIRSIEGGYETRVVQTPRGPEEVRHFVIRREKERFLRGVTEQSADSKQRALLWFNCHGTKDALIPSNHSSQNISPEELADAFFRSQADEARLSGSKMLDFSKKTVLFDSCFSSDFTNAFLARLRERAEGYDLQPPVVIASVQPGMLGSLSGRPGGSMIMHELAERAQNGKDRLTFKDVFEADRRNSTDFDRKILNFDYVPLPINISFARDVEDHAVFTNTLDVRDLLSEVERRISKDRRPPHRAPRREPRTFVPLEIAYERGGLESVERPVAS